jgi:hypothetical protein
MAQVANIDSNSSGLSFAEEASLKTLPGTPTWRQLEPNSYGDFGGTNTLIARNPINAGRQRKKGVVVDLESMAEFETDLTYSRDELQELWSGAVCADFHEKGAETVTAVDIDAGNPDEYEVAATAGFLVNSLIIGRNFTNAANNALNLVTAVTTNASVEVATGQLVAEASPPSNAQILVVGHQGATADITVDVSGTFPAYKSTSLDFTTLNLNPGEWIYVGGDATANKFANAANNGFKRIRSIATQTLTVDKSDATMVTDAGTGKDIQIFFGRFLRNEQGSDIVKKTYQMERTLGAPDDAQPTQIQSEYITGAMVNEVEMTIAAADKVLVNWAMMGLDNELRDGATGVKSGNRPALVSDDAFNTSSDFSRIRLAPVSATDEAPTSQFVYVMEMTLNINNNITANKAVSVLGGFGLTLGTFEVGATLNAYLSTIDALQSVKDNDSVTLDVAMVKANKGMVFDFPLGTLGDGRPDVEQDQSVMVPLEFQAAEATAVSTDYDYSMSITFFDYLPSAAG